jgi:HSP20 family protein
LPGIKKDKVEITREDNILKVRGERKEERKLEETKSHYSEVFYGTFTREFILPANADKEKEIKVHYEDGVLLITVPKSTKSQAQQIKIE